MNRNDSCLLPAMMVPSYRTARAVAAKVEKNLIFRTWGGLGDQICAEPTLRFVLDTFKGCDISLASEQPELFSHLNFKEVVNLKKYTPNYDNYLEFDTIVSPPHLVWEFFSHCLTHCVDFPSLCAIRCTLPNKYKEIKLSDKKPDLDLDPSDPKYVFVHPGRHWQSKTFPKEWWEEVLSTLINHNKTPVIIGADTDDNRGTVDVYTKECTDLRNQTSILETIWLMKRCRVLLTNDSSPLHMAAAGNAWIGFVATCKHPDYITHWRKGEFGWRMKNFGKGGIWDITDNCPNKLGTVTVEDVGDANLRSWLPDPKEFALWAVEKANDASYVPIE